MLFWLSPAKDFAFGFHRLAIFDFDTNKCWKKRLPLSNGRESEKLKHMMGFITYKNVSATSFDSHISSNKIYKSSLMILVFILLGGSLLMNFIVLTKVAYLACVLKCCKLIRCFRKFHGSSVAASLHQFTYQELTEATNGFAEELGRGSYGVVFKGQTEFGTVAVKLLTRLFSENEKEFQAEVNIIGPNPSEESSQVSWIL